MAVVHILSYYLFSNIFIVFVAILKNFDYILTVVGTARFSARGAGDHLRL